MSRAGIASKIVRLKNNVQLYVSATTPAPELKNVRPNAAKDVSKA